MSETHDFKALHGELKRRIDTEILPLIEQKNAEIERLQRQLGAAESAISSVAPWEVSSEGRWRYHARSIRIWRLKG